LLRHLDLDLDSDLSEVLVLHDVPQLHTVVLDVVARFNVDLPWTQLTRLTLRWISLENCVRILQQATNLVHLQLDLCACEADDHLSDLKLPHLESLCCNDMDDNDPMAVYLDAFIVPALLSLEVTESLLQPDPINSLTSFITKSGCKLRQVRISGERSVRKESYHGAFPSIPKFSFDGPCAGDEEEESVGG